MNRRAFVTGITATIVVLTLPKGIAAQTPVATLEENLQWKYPLPIREAARHFTSEAPLWTLFATVYLYEKEEDAITAFATETERFRANSHSGNDAYLFRAEITDDAPWLGEDMAVFEGQHVESGVPVREIVVHDRRLIAVWHVRGEQSYFLDISWGLAEDVFPMRPLKDDYLDAELLAMLPTEEEAANYGLTLQAEWVVIPD